MNEEVLKYLQELRDEKDLDAIAELFDKITAMFGLTAADAAAVHFYAMKRTLSTPVNVQWFKEHLKLDPSDLSIDGVLQMQKALFTVYVTELMKGGTK